MFDNQDTSTIKNNLIIDFPYLNYQFKYSRKRDTVTSSIPLYFISVSA